MNKKYQGHTPGPFHAGSDFDNGEKPITAIYDARCIYVGSSVGDTQMVSCAERRANARLFADAPLLARQNAELRKALQGLLECCPCQNGCAPDDMSCASAFARTTLLNCPEL